MYKVFKIMKGNLETENSYIYATVGETRDCFQFTFPETFLEIIWMTHSSKLDWEWAPFNQTYKMLTEKGQLIMVCENVEEAILRMKSLY